MSLLEFTGPCIRTLDFSDVTVSVQALSDKLTVFDSPPSPQQVDLLSDDMRCSVFVPKNDKEPGLDSLVFLPVYYSDNSTRTWVVLGFQDKESMDEDQYLGGPVMFNAWKNFMTTMNGSGWEDSKLYFCFRARRSLRRYLSSGASVPEGFVGLDPGERWKYKWKNVAALSLDPIDADFSLLANWFGRTLFDAAARWQITSKRNEPHQDYKNPNHVEIASKRKDTQEKLLRRYVR